MRVPRSDRPSHQGGRGGCLVKCLIFFYGCFFGHELYYGGSFVEYVGQLGVNFISLFFRSPGGYQIYCLRDTAHLGLQPGWSYGGECEFSGSRIGQHLFGPTGVNFIIRGGEC